MEFNLPLNIVYDRTLNNCPECGSDNTSLLFLIPVGTTSKPRCGYFSRIFFPTSLPIEQPTTEIKKSEEKCKDCGFTSEYRFELLNKINRRSEKIDKILDK